MRRDPRLYLDDIIEAIAQIREYTSGFDYPKFTQDRKTQDAVVRNLEIIGEAAARTGQETRDCCPQIPWVQIVAMRNRLVHVYFDIDLDQVWKAVTEDIPHLAEELRNILEAMTGS